MSLFNFWADPALQRLKETLTMVNIVRDTVKVTTYLLTRIGKTGRMMEQLRLSGDKQRDAAKCTETLTHVTTGCEA